MPPKKKEHNEGFVYCYNGLYSLLFYWGVITFRLHSHRNGGPKSTALGISYAMGMRLGLVFGFLLGLYIKLSDNEMSQAMFSQVSPLVKIIFSWESLSSILTYIQFCVTLDGHRRRHIRLLNRMEELDSSVSAQFPYVRWRYNRTRSKYWYGTVSITLGYNLVSLALLFEMTHCSCGFVSTILVACTYAWLTSSLGAMGFIHIGLMDYLRIRYRLIMKLLQQLYATTEAVGAVGAGAIRAGAEAVGARAVGAETAAAANLHQNIVKLFEYSKHCSQLLRELNVVCGVVAATGFFYDFTHMTCFVYLLCQKILHSEPLDTQYAFITLHLVVHIYKVIITCAYGYLLEREKRSCLRLLSEYAVQQFKESEVQGDRRSRETLVDCFQHWRMHNNHVATVGNSFNCNISLIYVIFNGLANYVVVLVQLLFQLQLKDQHQLIPKDVELIKTKT